MYHRLSDNGNPGLTRLAALTAFLSVANRLVHADDALRASRERATSQGGQWIEGPAPVESLLVEVAGPQDTGPAGSGMPGELSSIVGTAILLRGTQAAEGLAVHNVAQGAAEEWIDHGDVTDDDSHESFAHSPGTSLLSAANGVAEDENASEDTTSHDEDASREHASEESLALEWEVGPPKHLWRTLVMREQMLSADLQAVELT